MSEDRTTWSQTLLDGFIRGMKTQPTDDWIRAEARELADRGISVDDLVGHIRHEVGDTAADHFATVLGKEMTHTDKRKKKTGLLGKLFRRQ
jgi:hypothetical protein